MGVGLVGELIGLSVVGLFGLVRRRLLGLISELVGLVGELLGLCSIPVGLGGLPGRWGRGEQVEALGE